MAEMGKYTQEADPKSAFQSLCPRGSIWYSGSSPIYIILTQRKELDQQNTDP